MPDNTIYATSRGRVITDAEIEAMADEAEAGYELTKLRRRVPLHLLDSAPGEVVPVCPDAAPGDAIQQRADDEDTPPS